MIDLLIEFGLRRTHSYLRHVTAFEKWAAGTVLALCSFSLSGGGIH